MIRHETEKQPTRKAAMLTVSDVTRMQGNTTIKDKAYEQEHKKIYAAQLETQQSMAKNRRERM